MQLLRMAVLVAVIASLLCLGDGLEIRNKRQTPTLRCYRCEDASNSQCGDNFNATAVQIFPEYAANALCYKEKRTGDENRITRGATSTGSGTCEGQTDGCTKTSAAGNNGIIYITVCCCSTDLCNGGGFPSKGNSYFANMNIGLLLVTTLAGALSIRLV